MAIALDTSAQASNLSGSSDSRSYTCTGSNLILFVAVQITDGTSSVSSITYGGVSLTKITSKATPNNSRLLEMWYLLNPSTGSNTLTTTLTGSVSNWFNIGIASYTGVKQSGQPDAFGSTGVDSGITDWSQSVTTIADNCWLFGSLCNGAALNPSADSGTTIRQSIYNRTGNGYEQFIYDSNGAKSPAGSYALGITATSSGGTMIVVSFSPLTATVAGRKTLLGVGI